MANFATLADVLSGCVTQVAADACSSLFAAATGPAGGAPTNTLTAAESIARASWYKPERVFALLDAFYPMQKGKITASRVPFMPYLSVAPSAWVLPLKFDGGGYRAGGKAMFDSEGNLWVGDNFTVGWQAQDTLWQGNFSKFAPNGKPLSPMTTGFSGGGFAGGTFGNAVDDKDNVWLTSYGGHAISKFDKNGKSLGGSGRHHVQRPARPDAGCDRHAQQRCLGGGHFQEPIGLHPQRRSAAKPSCYARASRMRLANHLRDRSTLALTSRTASG